MNEAATVDDLQERIRACEAMEPTCLRQWLKQIHPSLAPCCVQAVMDDTGCTDDCCHDAKRIGVGYVWHGPYGDTPTPETLAPFEKGGGAYRCPACYRGFERSQLAYIAYRHRGYLNAD